MVLVKLPLLWVAELMIELEENVTLWSTFPAAHVHVTAAPGATLMCCGSDRVMMETRWCDVTP